MATDTSELTGEEQEWSTLGGEAGVEVVKPTAKRAAKRAAEPDLSTASDRDRLKHAFVNLRKRGMTTAFNTSGNTATQFQRLVDKGAHGDPGIYLPVDEIRKGFDRAGNIRAGDHVTAVFPAGEESDVHDVLHSVGLSAGGLEYRAHAQGQDMRTINIYGKKGVQTLDKAGKINEALDELVRAARSGDDEAITELREHLEGLLTD